MVGAADRMRWSQTAVDAMTASRTIRSEEDGCPALLGVTVVADMISVGGLCPAGAGGPLNGRARR
jgi:hypothetical protein